LRRPCRGLIEGMTSWFAGVKYDYPPDKQPGAIKLVMEQMEQLAPRYAASPAIGRDR
jgi:hypothetical protein